MDVIFVIILGTALYALIVNLTQNRTRVQGPFIPWVLYGVHLLLTLGYMSFTYGGSSDSFKYYRVSAAAVNWMDLYGTGTFFINFFAWPFTHFFMLSYYATMFAFSFFGLIGFYLLYRAAKENIKPQPEYKPGFGLIELVFILPNAHFWSSSLGKGSLMLFSMGLIFWGLSRFNRRYIQIIIGCVLIYYIRPHILLAVVMGSVCGLLFTNTGLKSWIKWALIFSALALFLFINKDVVEFANTDSLNIFDSGADDKLHKQIESLSRANSGVDINSYSLPMKLFTFWFRPLFVDATSMIGFVSSFENVFYIFMFIAIFREVIKSWNDWNGWFKICLFVFIIGSLALAQISGNLGIAMRQKGQIMPVFFIIYCKAMSYSKKRE